MIRRFVLRHAGQYRWLDRYLAWALSGSCWMPWCDCYRHDGR